MVFFPLIASLVFMLYLKRSLRRFCLFREVYGRRLVFFLGGVFICLKCALFSPHMGKCFDDSFLSMFNFKENW